ncbi:MAG: glycoside hydrolase family 97 protein, partial [Prevotellaceae bacterium]|nr:glycoside hydrolase family 97 protein [Prevotellaceae bacterium]
MKKIYLLLFVCGIAFTAPAQKNIELLSPDGNIKLSVTLSDKITYAVSYKNDILLQNNELQLQLRNETLGKNPKLSGQKRSSVDTEFKPVVPFKFSTVKNRYNQLLLNFKGGYSVEFRAFDDGVASRFITAKKGKIEVLDEGFDLSFTGDYLVHSQFPGEGGFNSFYEEPYSHVESKQWKTGEMSCLPVLIDTRRDVKILFSEADLTDYPCMFLSGKGVGNGAKAVFPPAPLETKHDPNGRNIRVTKSADYIAKTDGSRTFPWRWFVIADNDGRIIESTMVARLSPQNVDYDVSWIKPGLVAWDWMNRRADYGPEVNYSAGVNTAAYKHYIDFASRNKISYMLFDEGWSKNNAHPMEVRPEVDIPELVRYGRERNVGIILWITFSGIQEDFDDDSFNLFEHFSKMGIAGFKIDFMDRNDQGIVNFYEQAARESAKYKMLVELHGSYKPVGMEYRYPHVLSYEGVRGTENWKDCTPDNNLYMPFIRNVVGPMSFCPGAMLTVQPEQYNRLGTNLVLTGTRVHHIAYYILFESGLQMISDSPRQFDQNPDCRDFIFSTPVTWDETYSLTADAGQYAVVARRHGDKWWIGGITNNAQKTREFDVKLDFLPKGKTYHITIFEDGL